VANAVEPGRQQVKQEAADELVDAERHDLLAVRAVAAIVLVAEGDAGLVEGEQPAVRDGDAVTYLTSAARSGRLVSCQTILSWPSTLKPPPKAPVPVNVYA
jgi:hypothetical protein